MATLRRLSWALLLMAQPQDAIVLLCMGMNKAARMQWCEDFPDGHQA